jgi:hypothetical protein
MERIAKNHRVINNHRLSAAGLLKQFVRIMPGPVIEWLINRGIERIRKTANAISLKDYSSFLRSKEAPP